MATSMQPFCLTTIAILLALVQCALDEASHDYACRGTAWLDVQRELLQVVHGQVSPQAFAESYFYLVTTDEDMPSSHECILGWLSLRLLFTREGTPDYKLETQILRFAGWHRIIRSGWPIFRMLRGLDPGISNWRKNDAAAVSSTNCLHVEDDPSGSYYRNYLFNFVVKNIAIGDGIVPETAAFLAQNEHQNACTVAAAFLSLAWSRIPIYNHESDALVRRAHGIVENLSVTTLVLSYKLSSHPLLVLLDELSANFQGFLVDSGMYYYDKRTSNAEPEELGLGDHTITDAVAGQKQGDKPYSAIDYTRHMMEDASTSNGKRDPSLPSYSCIVGFAARQRSGFIADPNQLCDPYAAISLDLARWQLKRVKLSDVQSAFNQVTDAKQVVFRYNAQEGTLTQVVPAFSHLNVSSAAHDDAAVEPRCLADALLDVLGRVSIPRSFDMVLNHGDLPLLRKRDGTPPFYGLNDKDSRRPVPLFSIASSREFYDILFPNVCRPRLVNLTQVTSATDIPWQVKREVGFWRGTDRGAVNWARSLQEIMSLGSPRKNFLDTVMEKVGDKGHQSESQEQPLYDVAFLEDELTNSTVVNSDPNFVPLDQQSHWKYIIDLPGNGYSGSLKQKLTGSSAVLLATELGRGTPLYEHYHLGLVSYHHVLPLRLESAVAQLHWARSHDAEMRSMVTHANRYMEGYDFTWRCYVWRLISTYSELLDYNPGSIRVEESFPGSYYQTRMVRRTPTDTESQEFELQCRSHMQQFA